MRARGGYVVGAGSAVDGRRYEELGGPLQPLLGWLAVLLTSRPSTPTGAPARPAALTRTVKASDAYVATAFESEIGAVLSAWEGARNQQLNKSAFALARFVAAGQLDRDTTVTALARAAEHIGLDRGETTRTLRSAFSARGVA